jgi:hypothetical protein
VPKPRLLAALTAVAVLAGGSGTALAQSSEGDSTVTIGPRVTLSAGQNAPMDAPGAPQIRRGKPIPRGWVLVGRSVSGPRSGVGAAIRFTCPDGKRLRTFGITGRVGFQSTRDYVDHRSTVVTTVGSRGAGTVYAVCR